MSLCAVLLQPASQAELGLTLVHAQSRLWLVCFQRVGVDFERLFPCRRRYRRREGRLDMLAGIPAKGRPLLLQAVSPVDLDEWLPLQIG